MGWFQLPWMAVEWLWLALAGPFVTLLAHCGIETTPFSLYGNHFWYCRQFSVRRSITYASKNDNSLKVVTIRILAFLSAWLYSSSTESCM